MPLTVAWISSNYFESLLLPQRRKRLEAIGWISGYAGCPCRSPSFGFCFSFLVWFCFLWNWPPLWNIELPSGSNKNFNFIPWLTTFFLHWSNVTSNNPYRVCMYLGLILNRSVTFLSVSLVRITSKSPRVGLFNIIPSLQVNLSAVAFSEVVNSLNWDGWQ